MQLDPMENWRQLTQHYAEISDGELQALADDYRDLTEMARQALRDEMRKRGLGDPQSFASSASTATQSNSTVPPAVYASGDQPESFVWKSVLCDCSNRQEAWQISEVLRRAGIESWDDGSQTYYTPLPEMGAGPSRVRILVASDQLDAARAILSHPIPQDIVEQSKAEDEEYQPPVCPRCGASDPVLENIDPATNFWKCEVCGRQWTEPAEQTE